MLRKVGLSLAVLVCLAGVSQAATSIVVGSHLLLPNTPNQVVQIFVTGGDQIQGVNLNAQIGTDPSSGGTPVFQYTGVTNGAYPGPTFSTLLAPGSVFAPPVGFGENDVTFYPALWQSGSATASANGFATASGLLATLVIDTTGFTSGTWALNLSDTIVGPTDWAGSIFQGNEVPNPVITDGSISIVPEPGSIVLALFGAAGLGAVAIRRRRARQA